MLNELPAASDYALTSGQLITIYTISQYLEINYIDIFSRNGLLNRSFLSLQCAVEFLWRKNKDFSQVSSVELYSLFAS